MVKLIDDENTLKLSEYTYNTAVKIADDNVEEMQQVHKI